MKLILERTKSAEDTLRGAVQERGSRFIVDLDVCETI